MSNVKNLTPMMNVRDTSADAEMAKLCGGFLLRVNLQGAEVPQYAAVMNWLQGMSDAKGDGAKAEATGEA